MDKVHDDVYGWVHRETFELWQELDLEEVSLPTLQQMRRRLTKTIGNMHQQVHECREKLGLSSRNWPVREYLNPLHSKKGGKNKRRRSPVPPYVLPDDPAARKEKIKPSIRRYQAFRRKVQGAIEKRQNKAKIPSAPSI